MIPTWVGVFCILVSFPFVLVGLLWGYFKCYRLLRNGVRTKSIVVEYDNSGEASYPVVEFQDQAGQVHRVRMPVGEQPPSRKIGDSIRVLYHPDNPSNIVGTSLEDFWLIPIGTIGLGGVGVVIGVLICLGVIQNR